MLTLVWMLVSAPAVAGPGDPLDESAGGVPGVEALRPRRTSDDGRWWWYALPPDGVSTGPRVGTTHQYGPKASAIRDWVIQYTP